MTKEKIIKKPFDDNTRLKLTYFAGYRLRKVVERHHKNKYNMYRYTYNYSKLPQQFVGNDYIMFIAALSPLKDVCPQYTMYMHKRPTTPYP